MAVTAASTSTRSSNQFFDVTTPNVYDSSSLQSNKDNIVVPCDSDGTNPVYTNANVTFSVYEGKNNVTSQWTLSIYSSSYTTGTLVSGTYMLTALSADSGFVTIRASRNGYSSLYRTINIYKIRAGEAAPSTYIAFAKDKDGTGFTTTYNEDLEFYAILVSPTQIPVLSASNFTNLWTPLYNRSKLPTYLEMSTLDTENCGWNSLSMTHVALRPQSYHYKGTYNRLYFVLFDWSYNALGVQRAAPHSVNSTKVGYYDLDTRSFSPFTTIAHLYNTSTDSHDFSSMIVADNGHIIVAKEQLQSNGAHNSPIEIWRSDNVEDISTFTKIATLSRVDYNGFSYPTFHKNTTTGRLMMTLRGQPGHHNMFCIAVSDDNGYTWEGLDGVSNRPSPIASCADIAGVGLDWYFYTNKLNGSRNNGICVVANINEGPNGTSPDGTLAASRNKFLAYFYSEDGITWGNVNNQFNTSGSFTKNVVTEGIITPAEIIANFLISRIDTTPYKSYALRDVAATLSGIPYVMYSVLSRWDSTLNPDYSTKDNVVDNTYITYFDESTNDWINVDVTGIEKHPDDVDATKYSYVGYRPVMIVQDGGIIDVIIRKVITKTDFYKTPIVLDAGTKALGGGIFKILTTTANNFGEGLVVGDYFTYGSSTYTSRINASNTLTPLESEVCFLRSSDNGVTWSEVREPIFTGYLASNGILGCSSNILDSGVLGLFVGEAKVKSGETVYSYNSLALITEKLKSYNP